MEDNEFKLQRKPVRTYTKPKKRISVKRNSPETSLTQLINQHDSVFLDLIELENQEANSGKFNF